VNIAGGAFMGLESVVTRLMSGKERVRVLIEFLGRQVEVELGKELLVQNESARAYL
jgi:transcription antitermination factor NusG